MSEQDPEQKRLQDSSLRWSPGSARSFSSEDGHIVCIVSILVRESSTIFRLQRWMEMSPYRRNSKRKGPCGSVCSRPASKKSSSERIVPRRRTTTTEKEAVSTRSFWHRSKEVSTTETGSGRRRRKWGACRPSCFATSISCSSRLGR